MLLFLIPVPNSYRINGIYCRYKSGQENTSSAFWSLPEIQALSRLRFDVSFSYLSIKIIRFLLRVKPPSKCCDLITRKVNAGKPLPLIKWQRSQGWRDKNRIWNYYFWKVKICNFISVKFPWQLVTIGDEEQVGKLVVKYLSICHNVWAKV